jgi:hypothetical protein
MCSSALAMSVPRPAGSSDSTSRITRSTCRVPLRGGTAFSIRSLKMTSPTLSLLVMAEKAKRAPSSAASAALVWRTLPNCVLALASTSSRTVSSRSSA